MMTPGFGSIARVKGTAPPPPYSAFALDFDDNDDRLRRTSDLTGNADAKSFTASLWFIRDGGSEDQFYTSSGFAVLIRVNGTTDRVEISAENAAGTKILEVVTTATFIGPTAWIHLAFSCNLANVAQRHLLINGVSDANWLTYTDDTIDFTQGQHNIGCSTGVTFMNGGLADVWIDFGRYVDFSVPANLQLFRSLAGKPVDLGADGSTPFAVAPIMFFRSSDGTAANWNNQGTGGVFVQEGTPAQRPTSPSD